MMRRWSPRALVYLGLAIAGLAITWTFNGLAIAESSEWFGEWFSNGAATQSLQWDLVIVVTAASIFIVGRGSSARNAVVLGARAAVPGDRGRLHRAALPRTAGAPIDCTPRR